MTTAQIQVTCIRTEKRSSIRMLESVLGKAAENINSSSHIVVRGASIDIVIPTTGAICLSRPVSMTIVPTSPNGTGTITAKCSELAVLPFPCTVTIANSLSDPINLDLRVEAFTF